MSISTATTTTANDPAIVEILQTVSYTGKAIRVYAEGFCLHCEADGVKVCAFNVPQPVSSIRSWHIDDSDTLVPGETVEFPEIPAVYTHASGCGTATSPYVLFTAEEAAQIQRGLEAARARWATLQQEMAGWTAEAQTAFRTYRTSARAWDAGDEAAYAALQEAEIAAGIDGLQSGRGR